MKIMIFGGNGNCFCVFMQYVIQLSNLLRLHAMRKLPEEAIKSDLLSSTPTYKGKLRAFYHAWNPNDCSKNIYIKASQFTLHR